MISVDSDVGSMFTAVHNLQPMMLCALPFFEAQVAALEAGSDVRRSQRPLPALTP